MKRYFLITFILIFAFLSSCSPALTPEPTAVPTNKQILLPEKTSTSFVAQNTPSESIELSNPALSYLLSDQVTQIDRSVTISGYEVNASGDKGQIPCEHQARLSFTILSIDPSQVSITIKTSDSIQASVNDPVQDNDSHSFDVIFFGQCPLNGLENISYHMEINLNSASSNALLTVNGELFKPFSVGDLALPYDTSELAIAISEPGVHLEYKLETRPEGHVRGPHLGDMIEIASDNRNTQFPESPVSIIAPIDMKIINLWGFDDRLICMNTFVGFDELVRPIYYSFYHLDSLDISLIKLISKKNNIPFQDFLISETGWGEKVIHPEIIIEKSTKIGFFDHFESRDYWGDHIASQLHINLTHTDPTDNLMPYHYAIDFSSHYISEIFDHLLPGQSFILIIDEGADEKGEAFTENNPVPMDIFRGFLSEEVNIVSVDYRSVIVRK